MSANIKQVYDSNPSTTLADDDLLYSGKSPYAAIDDSAIKVVDFLNNLSQDVITSETVQAGKGFISAAASLSEIGANADPALGVPHLGQYTFHIQQTGPNDALFSYNFGVTKTFSINNVDQRLGGTLLSTVTVEDPNGGGSVTGSSTGMFNILGSAAGVTTTGSFGKYSVSNDRNKNESAFFGAYQVTGGSGQAWLSMGLRNAGTDNIYMIMDPDGDPAFSGNMYAAALYLSGNPFDSLTTGTTKYMGFQLGSSISQNTFINLMDPGQSSVTIPLLISNTSGLIVQTAPGIASPVSSSVWHSLVSSSGQNMTVGGSYAATNSSLDIWNLPTTAVAGEIVEISDAGTGRVKVGQAASQFVQAGDKVTTTGTGGSLTSTKKGDSLTLRNIVANNQWQIIDSIGTWTIV